MLIREIRVFFLLTAHCRLFAEFCLKVGLDLLEQRLVGWFFPGGGPDVEGVDRGALLGADARDVDAESVPCQHL